MASARRPAAASLVLLAFMAAACSKSGPRSDAERVMHGKTLCAGQSIDGAGDITDALGADAIVEVSGLHPLRAVADRADQNDVVLDLEVSRVLYHASTATVDPPRRVPALVPHGQVRVFEPVRCGESSAFATPPQSSESRTLVLLRWEDDDDQTHTAGTKWTVRPVLSESARGVLSFNGDDGYLGTQWRQVTQLPVARQYRSQRALLVAWVAEIHGRGSTAGPITSAFRSRSLTP